jgi:hypothetical protein
MNNALRLAADTGSWGPVSSGNDKNPQGLSLSELPQATLLILQNHS